MRKGLLGIIIFVVIVFLLMASNQNSGNNVIVKYIEKEICNCEIIASNVLGSNNQLEYALRYSINNLNCYVVNGKTTCSFGVDGEAYTSLSSGTSMLPCSQTGSTSLILKTDDIEVGDFVVYWKDKGHTRLSSHQVVGTNVTSSGLCYVVQGINNLDIDKDCVMEEDVYGRVIVIFRDGIRQ